jgi:hypothetical protein
MVGGMTFRMIRTGAGNEWPPVPLEAGLFDESPERPLVLLAAHAAGRQLR